MNRLFSTLFCTKANYKMNIPSNSTVNTRVPMQSPLSNTVELATVNQMTVSLLV